MGASELVFAATLRSNIKGARDAMVELCALLSEDMGRVVTPLGALAPSVLADALASGAAHFGWVSPTLVLDLAHDPVGRGPLRTVIGADVSAR